METEPRCPGCDNLIDTSHNLKTCPSCGHLLSTYVPIERSPRFNHRGYALLIAIAATFVLAIGLGVLDHYTHLPKILAFPATILLLAIGAGIFRALVSLDHFSN